MLFTAEHQNPIPSLAGLLNTTVIVFALFTSGLQGQVAGPTGSLEGTVLDATTQRPIAGASLELSGLGIRQVTNGDGNFRFVEIPVGIYELTSRSLGYRPHITANVVVGSGKTASITVTMNSLPLRLEDIEVRPETFVRRPEFNTDKSLDTEDIRRAPGVQEDVIRSIALLPGVGVTAAGRNDLIVRGGAPYENLFLVDGIEIGNINHFGSQGSTGGPLSIINVDFVSRADFSASGFSPKYGNRTSAVTAIELRDGALDRLSAEAMLSATGFGIMTEGPVSERTTFWSSIRRSYLDLIFKAAGFSFVPAYWDFQGKTTTRFSSTSTLSFLAIGALNSVTLFNDDSDGRYDNSRLVAPTQKQYFAGAIWKESLERGLLTVTLGRTFTRFESIQNDSLNPPNPVFQSRAAEGETSLRVDWVNRRNDNVELSFGAAAKFASALDYRILLSGNLRTDSLGNPAPLSIDTSFTALGLTSYGNVELRTNTALSFDLGLRSDYYAFLNNEVYLSPRLAVRADWETTSAYLNFGSYRQPPSFIWLVGDPQNRTRLRPIHSTQISAGIERILGESTKLQVETYHKWYSSYPSRLFRPLAVLAPSGFEDATTDIPFGLEPLSSDGTGRAYGVEVFLQEKMSSLPLYGFLSAGISRSEFSGLGDSVLPGAFDTRFIGNVLAGYRPGRNWELSGKFRIATGNPTTPFLTTGPEAGRTDFSRYNSGPRLPVTHSFDARIDRRWSFTGVQLDTYIDIQNLYGKKNVFRIEWNQRTGAPEYGRSLGVLPTIGVNIEF